MTKRANTVEDLIKLIDGNPHIVVRGQDCIDGKWMSIEFRVKQGTPLSLGLVFTAVRMFTRIAWERLYRGHVDTKPEGETE